MATNTGWQVTGQEADQVIVTQAGQTLTGTYVYFTTVNGNQGSVFVQDGHGAPKTVHGMIQQEANRIDQIGALHNGSFQQ